VALRGSEKDCVPLLRGVAEAEPPTGWSVGKGSQEPMALRGEDDGGADDVNVPPPRSPPTATVGETLLDVSGFVRVAEVDAPLTVAEPRPEALMGGDKDADTDPLGEEEAETEEVEDREGGTEGLSRERVIVTVQEKVWEEENDDVPERERCGDAEEDTLAVEERDGGGERDPLPVTRAPVGETQPVGDSERDAAAVVLREPPMGWSVGKGCKEPMALAGDLLLSAVAVKKDAVERPERENKGE